MRIQNPDVTDLLGSAEVVDEVPAIIGGGPINPTLAPVCAPYDGPPTWNERQLSTALTEGSGAPDAGYASRSSPPVDAKVLLKDDATYQQLVSDLSQLRGFGFDAIEAKFTGLFQSPDGKLSQDNLRWAATDGGKIEADAISLLGNPRLWREMDTDQDGLVSKDELNARIRGLKASMARMEQDAVSGSTSPTPTTPATPTTPTSPTKPTTPTTPTTPATTRMDAATAAEVLLANFDLVDSPTGGGKDGVSCWEEVLYVYDHTSDPKLKSAIKFFKEHRGEWHLMENLNSDKASLNDDVFSRDELAKYVEMKKSGACSSSSSTQTSTTGSTNSGGTSSSGSSALENASDRIGQARENVESRISELSNQLASLDPEKDGAKIAKLERQIQSLTNMQTMLAQLESQLTQMIQNMTSMYHDIAMNAVRHIN